MNPQERYDSLRMGRPLRIYEHRGIYKVGWWTGEKPVSLASGDNVVPDSSLERAVERLIEYILDGEDKS